MVSPHFVIRLLKKLYVCHSAKAMSKELFEGKLKRETEKVSPMTCR